MQLTFTTLTALLLFPLTLASPVAVSVSEADSISNAPIPDITPRDSVTTVFDRASGADCKIINVSSYVNCRSGPGTQYPVVYQLPTGVKIHFDCYKRGECINGNW
ncbi:hypothetical protein V499_05555 [Pseudogymnoascus sp. VKM F-103]|nr:hypothetical protein V499_05555 [Pseudogymnoascus sp. VKM F-103]